MEKEKLKDQIKEASEKHHDYETNYLEGQRDKNWAGWYAAFILGRLNEVRNKVTPTRLTTLFEEAAKRFSGENWAEKYADYFIEKIS